MSKFSVLGADLYTGKRKVDFVGKRKVWYAASAVVVLIAIAGLFVRGLDFGIDFTGGSQYTVSIDADQSIADDVREAVAAEDIEGATSPVVTTQGDSAILVQVESLSDEDSQRVVDAIVAETGIDPATELSEDEIGPSWGAEVAERSTIGLIVFLVLVVLFIWASFRQWKMSIAALVALAHDVVITVGIYAILGFEVSPATVTGVLTVLAFSLYDTVVVFDKVRENTMNMKRDKLSYAEAANRAVNQTVVRSINTSVVAIIPVGVILAISTAQLGASSLKDLSLALFVGTAAGVYSSVFIATPLLVDMKSNEADVLESERRSLARQRAADRYASVPTFTENMPVSDSPKEIDEDDLEGEAAERDRDKPRVAGGGNVKTRANDDAMGRGRIAPESRRELGESKASGRTQPKRTSKSDRKKQ